MNRSRIIFFGLFFAVGALVALMFSQLSRPGAKSGDLVMFCAAGMKGPVDEVVAKYEEEYGVNVEVQYDGSGNLEAKLYAGGGADVFLAADSSYLRSASEKGAVAEMVPVCFLTAGIVVKKGNPKGVKSLEDLLRDEVNVGVANEGASVGKFTKEVLEKAGIWARLEPRLTVKKPTVTEVANDAMMGTVDAVIIWDAVAAQYPELEFVHVPEFDAEKNDVMVGVTTGTEKVTEALRFCRYLTARDRGLAIFEKENYEVVEGDLWALRPEIKLFSGAMLRPAIEGALTRFQEREGVLVNTVFDGCGILVSQMKSGQNPDAYFACDISFMDMVGDRFGKPTTVSENEMVILVKKGNPLGVGGAADLAKVGVRVGLAHPTKSALGKLTKDFLEKAGSDEAVRANLEVDSPTGDFLVNQLRAGSLDAVVVYRSNAHAHPETMAECEIVLLGGEATAEQPFAVGVNSDHKQLAGRLFDALARERANFEEKGFRWRMAQ